MDQIDQWMLEARIGSGGLAEVWRAVAADGSGKPVALKVLRDPKRSHAHRARFLREGRLLGRLDHPGLPRCYAVGEGEQPYLVLELLEGDTLSGRIRLKGPLSYDAVASLAASLLRVLDHIHQQGIVHRDVKSSNVYLAADRRVLLLDLGLAADPRDPLTTTLGDVMGTYAYMAPEQIAGAEVDHRCDLYSLGVTLYEALTGTRPFHAQGASGYLRAHREGAPTSLIELCPDAPIRLLDTVTQLMARDPLARPASAAIARATLTGATGVRRSLSPAPIAGRAAALGAIEAVLDAGGSLFLCGEIGSGTGRMATHALDQARLRGVETIALRCRARAAPLDPVEQLARDLARIVGRVDPSVEGLARATEALSEEGPLLYVIEDTEHLSPDAAQILGVVVAAAPKLALVMTGVRAPPGIPAHPVPLRALSPDEAQLIVVGMLSTPTPPAGLATQLHRMAGGLPALVVLGVKELVARGALWCEGIGEDGHVAWRLDRTVSIEPTTGLVRLFGTVLTQLPEASRSLLEVLAVVGEALPVDLALELCGADLSGMAMGPLLYAGLASTETHEDGDQIMLRRPAVGTLVMGQVPVARQTAIHRQLARALSALPPDPWRDQRLSWHAAHGAEPDDAPAALLALGDDLLRRGQYARSLDVLDRASKIAGAEARVSARLAIVRGEALDAVGRREEAMNAITAGHRLALDLRDPELVGRALVGLAQVHHGIGDERRAALLAEEALELVEGRPLDPSLPRALLLAATSHRLGARPEAASRLFHRAIEVANHQGSRQFVAMANGGLGALYAEEGHLDEAIHHLEQEAGYLRAHGPSHRLVPTLYRLGVAWRRQARPDLALEHLDEAEDIARFAQLPHKRALVRVGKAGVLIALGDIATATALMTDARVALDPEASTFVRIVYREVQAHLRLVAGDRQAALAVYQAAEVEATRAGFASAAAYFLGMLGVLTADTDAITEAMDVLGTAGDRRLAARLLLYGGTVGGDAEILESAEQEARTSGDRFLLLEVLHASGGAGHQEEARALVAEVLPHVPAPYRDSFLSLPAVRWCGLSPSTGRIR